MKKILIIIILCIILFHKKTSIIIKLVKLVLFKIVGNNIYILINIYIINMKELNERKQEHFLSNLKKLYTHIFLNY